MALTTFRINHLPKTAFFNSLIFFLSSCFYDHYIGGFELGQRFSDKRSKLGGERQEGGMKCREREFDRDVQTRR